MQSGEVHVNEKGAQDRTALHRRASDFFVYISPSRNRYIVVSARRLFGCSPCILRFTLDSVPGSCFLYQDWCGGQALGKIRRMVVTHAPTEDLPEGMIYRRILPASWGCLSNQLEYPGQPRHLVGPPFGPPGLSRSFLYATTCRALSLCPKSKQENCSPRLRVKVATSLGTLRLRQ